MEMAGSRRGGMDEGWIEGRSENGLCRNHRPGSARTQAVTRPSLSMSGEIVNHSKRGMMRRNPRLSESSKNRRTLVLAASVAMLCAAMLAAPRAAAAQQSDDGRSGAAEGRACFQPRPMPACRGFWITEFGAQWFVSPPPGVHNRRGLLATWELGWMQNRSADDAIGASIFLATNDHVHRSGVRARYRRSTGGGTAVDVSPALIVLQSDEDLEVRGKLGAALQAGVTWRDWIGVTSQVEATQSGVRLQAGVRLGGYPGAATGLALPLAALWAARHDES